MRPRLIRRILAALVVFVVLDVLVAAFTSPGSAVGDVARVFLRPGFVKSSLQAAVPLTLAGVGGLYAEKSGVVNIGIEGLLIVSAFGSVLGTHAALQSGIASGQAAVWAGFFTAVVLSLVLSALFAVICIEFDADQVIAGIAIWLLALGLAPFLTKVVWGRVVSGIVPTFDQYSVPVLASIPWVGPVFFKDVYPTTVMLLIVPIAWYVLHYTPYGTWVKASGEHPEALDTAGVNVDRVRYASVLVSGLLAGVGGTELTLARAGQFVGQGQTMVNGRGFIAIVTYLLGNYDPLGTFVSALLFAGLDAFQVRLQQISAIAVPSALVRIIPHVTVIIVLVFFGYTRIPSRAGENYESGEE